MFKRWFRVYTNCLIILLDLDVKHIVDTNFNQDDLFHFFFFTGSKLQVSKFAWQTLWEALSFEENGQRLYSQQGPFCLVTRWLLPF